MPIQELSANFEAADGVAANNYQYNGIELVEDFGLQVNHAQFRTLNPQTGVWWQIDPMAEKFYAWSPYNSNLGNPVRYDDPKGDTPGPGAGDHQPTNRNDLDGGGGGGAALGWSLGNLVYRLIVGAGIGFGADATVQVADKMITEGRSFPDAVSNMDMKSAKISAGTGAITFGASYNLQVIGAISNFEKLVTNTTVIAGVSTLESISKQATDNKRGPIELGQLGKDVIADVGVGLSFAKLENMVSSSLGKTAIDYTSEVSSNWLQNVLNSRSSTNQPQKTKKSDSNRQTQTNAGGRGRYSSYENQY